MKYRVTPFVNESDIESNAEIAKTFDNFNDAKPIIMAYWDKGYNTVVEPIEEGYK